MEGVRGDADGVHLGVTDLDAGGIAAGINLGFDVEAGVGGGRGDQLHDGLVADQRLSPPVLRDEREQAVLDLVSFAGARRQMTDGDGQAEFVGESLKFAFPQPYSRAVAATTIGGDQQAACLRIAAAPHGLPPASDRLDGKACGIVIDADADPAGIAGDVIDAIR